MAELNSSIPLSVNLPQATPISPMTSVGQMMQMRNQSSEMALRAAQTQQAQQQTANIAAEAKQKNMDIADQRTLQDASTDPDKHARLLLGDTSDIAGKVQMRTEQGVQEAAQKVRDQRASYTTTQLANRSTAETQAADFLDGIQNMKDADGNPDLAGMNQALQAGIPGLQKAGIFQALELDPAKFAGTTITDPKQIQQIATNMYADHKLTETVLARKNEQQKIATSAAEAAKDTAQASKDTAEGKHQELVNNLMSQGLNNPQQLDSGVDAVIDPKLYPEQNARAKAQAHLELTTSGDPKAAAAAVGKVAEEIGAVQKQKAEIPGEIEKATKIAKAEAPIHLATAVSTARALNGSGAVGNVPPHLVPAASAAYNKSGEALAGAQTASDQIQKVLALAESGNKAAGANVPLMGVGAVNAVNGIKRMNSAEISQYGGAGSLFDKIQGKLQGWTEGQPIPADVLHDMKTLHSVLAEGAQTKHAREVQSINQTYGSTFQPMKMESPKGPPIRARDPQGKLHEAPAGTPLLPGWKLETK